MPYRGKHKYRSSILLLLTIILILPVLLKGQSKAADTMYREHSPVKATYWSLLPGAGQIYNKKYWKVPIVYLGFGVIGYFAVANRQEYLTYREAYICSATLGDECNNELANKYSTDDLRSIRDYYRRNMELSYIVGGAWYILQMIDAVVDAHLYYWNVDDDVTVKVEPTTIPFSTQTKSLLNTNTSYINGIKISINF